MAGTIFPFFLKVFALAYCILLHSNIQLLISNVIYESLINMFIRVNSSVNRVIRHSNLGISLGSLFGFSVEHLHFRKEKKNQICLFNSVILLYVGCSSIYFVCHGQVYIFVYLDFPQGWLLRIQNQIMSYRLEEFAVKDKKSNLVE